jgi:crossover junction endodeoxyribonuclease RuvC
MRLLGIDPGLRRTGFGLIETGASRAAGQAVYLASGVIRPVPTGSEPQRLTELYTEMRQLLAELRPDCAVIERVFVNVNPKSTLSLGQARGVSIAALAAQGIDVHEITPLKVKQSIVGTGRADKAQVAHMVCQLLNLQATPNPDAADALACALAFWHAQSP